MCAVVHKGNNFTVIVLNRVLCQEEEPSPFMFEWWND
jgi:hypothetical protein